MKTIKKNLDIIKIAILTLLCIAVFVFCFVCIYNIAPQIGIHRIDGMWTVVDRNELEGKLKKSYNLGNYGAAFTYDGIKIKEYSLSDLYAEVGIKNDENLTKILSKIDVKTSDILKDNLTFSMDTEKCRAFLEITLDDYVKKIRGDENSSTDYHLIFDKDARKLMVSDIQYEDNIDFDAITKVLYDKLSVGEGVTIELKDYIARVEKETAKRDNLRKYLGFISDCKVEYENGTILPLTSLLSYYTLSDDEKHIILNKDLTDDFKAALELFVTEVLIPESPNEWHETRTTLPVTLGDKTYELDNYETGNRINVKKEVEYLFNTFKNFEEIKEEKRVPVLVNYGGLSDIDEGNYIHIEIKNQKMHVVRNGIEVVTTDVVTGNVSENCDTPHGIFYILEKKNNYTMDNENNTFVKYWLRITWKGVGIHDASWRSKFGGKIYKKNGSHGCINTPEEYMKEIFEQSKCYDTVVITE